MILATMNKWFLYGLSIVFLSFSVVSGNSDIIKADNFLKEGSLESALNVYDSILRKNPSDYLTRFKRGALYISLARHTKALEDFDEVLELQPDMKAALEQKVKLTIKLGRFTDALKEANEEHATRIRMAISSRDKSQKALKQKNFGQCIHHASVALEISPLAADIRLLRADCRLQQGDYHQSVADYRSAEKSGTMVFSPEIYVKTACIYYYLLNDYDSAMDQLRRCLQYDGDEVSCKNIHKKIRASNKMMKKLKKKSWKSVFVELVENDVYNHMKEETYEQLQEIKQITLQTAVKDSKFIHQVADLQCQAAYNIKKYNESLCSDVSVSSDEGIYFKTLVEIYSKMEKEDYEGALHVINSADIKHKQKLAEVYQQVQVALKQQRTKDYYKVLEIPRTASEKEIKAAYRKLSKIYHPDKAKAGDSEVAQKKMAEINEAYEILSDSDLRARYDQGEDINGQDASSASSPFYDNPFGHQQHPFFRQTRFNGHFKYSNFY